MVEIKEANTKRLRKKFIQFQNELYKDCPQYIPTMLSDEMANLNPEKNPAFDYCDMKLFLAMRDGKIVGRIAGIISHKANEIWNQKRIRISRFDFIDDAEVVDALVGAVEQWGRENGLNEVVGPLGFCDLDKEGMLVDGFEKKGLFITYYNHPYYVEHMNRLGFEKDVDWTEHKVYVESVDEEKLARICRRVIEKNKFRVVHVKSKKQVKPYIGRIFELLNSEYKNLYGVVPLTERQKEYYVSQFLLLLNLDYVGLIENEEGELVAMGVLAPGMADVMKKTGGRLFPFGWIPVLRNIQKPRFLDMYFIAVDSRYRNTGLSAVLLHEITKRAADNGILYAETGPQLEQNYNIQKLFAAYKVESNFKRRRCFKKAIGE